MAKKAKKEKKENEKRDEKHAERDDRAIEREKKKAAKDLQKEVDKLTKELEKKNDREEKGAEKEEKRVAKEAEKEAKDAEDDDETRALSSLEREYILSHAQMSAEEVFEKLEGAVSIEDIQILQEASSNPKEIAKSLIAGDLMARNKGSIAMTEASSALAEEAAKRSKNKGAKHNDRIHRINK